MHQFGNGDGRQRGFPLADPLGDLFEKLCDVEMLPFGLDDNTGVEDFRNGSANGTPKTADSMAGCGWRCLPRRPS
jgi:hypothetical protein